MHGETSKFYLAGRRAVCYFRYSYDMSQQDLYLIDQIKVRNKLSLQAYCDKHGGVLYSYLLTLLEQTPLADEVYEQTMVDLWEKSSAYDKTHKTPLQWTFDLAFQNALMKKRADHPDFVFKSGRPPKIDDEAQLKKDFPPKAPPQALWQKIQSRLISIPGTNTISATQFPASSIPPVTSTGSKPTPPKIPTVSTASIPPVASAKPAPKIPSSAVPVQSSRDISTVAQPVKLNPLTSAPPPIRVPPKAEPTGQIARKPEEKENDAAAPSPTTTDIPTQAAPPVVKLPPGLPPHSSITAPPVQNAPAAEKKPDLPPQTSKVSAPAASTADTKVFVPKEAPKKEASPTASSSADEKTKSSQRDDKNTFKPENQKLDEILKQKEAAKTTKKSASSAPQSINWWAVKTFVAWGFTVIFFAGFYWIYTKYNGQVEDMKRLRTEQLEAQSKVRSMEEQLQAARTLATGAQELERTFQDRLKQFQQTIDRLENEKASLMDDLKARDARIEFLEGNLGRVVFMASTSSSSAAFARCIWDDSAGTGVIYARNLPKLKEGKTWQVWAVINDQDVSIGFINPNLEGSGSGTLKLDGSKAVPQEFFVTDEPTGGSSGPTGETIISGS